MRLKLTYGKDEPKATRCRASRAEYCKLSFIWKLPTTWNDWVVLIPHWSRPNSNEPHKSRNKEHVNLNKKNVSVHRLSKPFFRLNHFHPCTLIFQHTLYYNFVLLLWYMLRRRRHNSNTYYSPCRWRQCIIHARVRWVWKKGVWSTYNLII